MTAVTVECCPRAQNQNVVGGGGGSTAADGRKYEIRVGVPRPCDGYENICGRARRCRVCAFALRIIRVCVCVCL